MSRSTHAAWDPDLGGTANWIKQVAPSNRRGRIEIIAGKPIAIPPSVPARKKDGRPDLGRRFTRATLEAAIAEGVRERQRREKERRTANQTRLMLRELRAP